MHIDHIGSQHGNAAMLASIALAEASTQEKTRVKLESLLRSSNRKESKRRFANFEHWDFGALASMEMAFSGSNLQHYVRRSKNQYVLTVQQALLAVKRMYDRRSIGRLRELSPQTNQGAWRNTTWSYQEFEKCLIAFLFIIIDHAVTIDDGQTPGMHDKALTAVLTGIKAHTSQTKK